MVTKNHPSIKAHQRKQGMTTEEKRKFAYDMRLKGHTETHIAKELGCTVSYISQLIKQGLDEAKQRNAVLGDLLLHMELERFDKLQPIYFEKALEGDKDAFYVVCRISERRAKMLGLDAPVKTETAIDDKRKGYIGFDLETCWEELKKKDEKQQVDPGEG